MSLERDELGERSHDANADADADTHTGTDATGSIIPDTGTPVNDPAADQRLAHGDGRQ